MGSSTSSASPNSDGPSAAFRRVFAAHADATGTMSFARFMELALYAPDVGYYRRPQPRVGYAPGTDFFTASTSGTVFGELVCAACVQLLGERDPKAHTFVEIGAEPSGGVLGGVSHPFGATRVIGVGEPIELTGACVVFSNELFDAQPLRRFRFRAGAWRELGVRLDGEVLTEVELPRPLLPAVLPVTSIEGYTIDAPLAAVDLAERIAAQPWTGAFVAFDYGKSWPELVEAAPGGTARAYHRHTQTNDLLARPGEQDLTGHVCWDWLAAALERNGFRQTQVETQEAFFIRRAESYLAPAIAADAARFTPRKQSLLQLLHGSHLGQKFQVLHGLR
jgi:SAM-dependent MidA family methyltransferase